jgi:23S rRNA (guanosine2251-2'-O)-methyltransferase
MRNVEGRNPVIELLNNNSEIEIIYLQKGLRSDKIKQIENLAKSKNIEIQWLSKYKLDQKAVTENHQGVVAKTVDIKTYDLYEVIDEINTNNNTYDLSELNEEIKKLENDKLSY